MHMLTRKPYKNAKIPPTKLTSCSIKLYINPSIHAMLGDQIMLAASISHTSKIGQPVLASNRGKHAKNW
uniref:Uncharacterized protein n=1 Tax=Arundo donax TaxID=35708 RepID=A0A0A9HIM6_ARUDO